AVDAIQIPASAAGPVGWFVGVGLDVATMAAMWALLGFHWAFLPSFLTEWIPYLDMAPIWTLAVAIATRGRSSLQAPDNPLPERRSTLPP
ncbi:MAG TPA: hypothetical protein VK150_03450, partial [Geothrix sp.]|nr:hypothetical protein [Geothrix sp.]